MKILSEATVKQGEPKFLEALAGKSHKAPPMWLMRQAGRYLAEYREVRAKAGSFLNLCYTSALAAEATIQPIRRFGFDAAIIFSDILVVPHALGQHLELLGVVIGDDRFTQCHVLDQLGRRSAVQDRRGINRR